MCRASFSNMSLLKTVKRGLEGPSLGDPQWANHSVYNQYSKCRQLWCYERKPPTQVRLWHTQGFPHILDRDMQFSRACKMGVIYHLPRPFLLQPAVLLQVVQWPLESRCQLSEHARKAKKRRGRNASGFADFSSYPNMEVGLECNICDLVISDPCAYRKKRGREHYYVCRGLLLKVRLVMARGSIILSKVIPSNNKNSCSICDQLIAWQFYHCARCIGTSVRVFLTRDIRILARIVGNRTT